MSVVKSKNLGFYVAYAIIMLLSNIFLCKSTRGVCQMGDVVKTDLYAQGKKMSLATTLNKSIDR